MKGVSRRNLLATAAVGALSVAAPAVARSRARPRVVVIGGGPGGATVAKDLARGGISVTLVEPKERYTTCFFSNLYLAGWRPIESITFTYVALVARHGVRHVRDTATAVDPMARRVHLASGHTLGYDKLVVAPGIDLRFRTIEGYSQEAASVMPHAYQAGEQTMLLRRQLEAMEDGGTFLLAAPPNPYRCPPGPYERATLVAHYFRKHKPKSKILILDAKESFSKQALFEEAWETYYDGMIEWVPGEFGGRVEAVDPGSMRVIADGETHHPAVANIIPAQKAGWIAETAGLVDDGGWCPIDPETMESKRHPDIYVLGDASIASEMPKSAFAAHSQARVVAMDIRHRLLGEPREPARYRNACWSTLAEEDAVKVGATYRPGSDRIEAVRKFISSTGEPAEVRARTRAEAEAWYRGFTRDIFG